MMDKALKRVPNRLFVSDLDGTLLDGNSRVSSRSAEIISKLSDAGAMITIATARTPATVDVLLSHTRLSLPAIVMTGAALWDTVNKKYDKCRFIDAESSKRILDICRRGGVTPFVYLLGGDGLLHSYYNGTMSRREEEFAAERSHLPLKRMHINEQAMESVDAYDDSILYFAMGPREKISEVANEIKKLTDCSVSDYVDIFSHSTGILEVFAPGVSKASAVKAMARKLGVEGITVFGDNLNDIPMMELADDAVAVANAFPEVKRVARHVIGPNTDDAVARYILEQCS